MAATALKSVKAAKSDALILIVDDKAANLFALERTLASANAQIVKASSGDEALGLALRHEFALAILDVQMPGMDGYELAELLLGNPSTVSLPIIFVSAAHGDELHRFKGYESGAVDYLVKPVDPKILLGKVNVFLELAAARAELQSLVRERTAALNAKAEQLARKGRFRRVLSEASRNLTRRNAVDGHEVVVGALGRVASFVGATCAFVLLDPAGHPSPPSVHQTLEWHADADAPRLGEAILRRPDSAFLAVGPAHGGDGAFLPSLEDLPTAADVERAALERCGVRELLWLPILEGDEVMGGVALGWDAPAPSPLARRERLELVELLAPFPEIVFSALLTASAESRRLQSEAQHRLLFETMSQGVVYRNLDGTMIAANPAAHRILDACGLRLPEPDACADLPWTREDGSPLSWVDAPATLALRTGVSTRDVSLGLADGAGKEHRSLTVSAVPLYRPGEVRPFQVYETFTDVTELRRATAEKERLMNVEAESRAKSRFLASMSHEIRTPMNAILGFTQLMLREAGLTGRQREYLQTIDRSGEHLITLVNNVLDMARIEAGKETVDVSAIDFADLLTDLERMFRLKASQKGLGFRVEREEAFPRRLRLDAGKVRQVLINLLGNAMKFTDVGEVVLGAGATRLSAQAVRVDLEVRDTGIGIPAERLSDVFEPFTQIVRSSGSAGTGIGLAVCRRFASLLGGNVSASSTLGHGSTFRFSFVAQTADGESIGPPPERVVGLAHDAENVSVLVVEDDDDNRTMMTNMIRSVGLTVRSAANASDAVDAFRREPCDIVLTDLLMPGENGLELMQRIRTLPGGDVVPVVVVSASTMVDEKERVLAAGVDGFVSKPVRESGVFHEIGRLTRAKFAFAGDAAPPSQGAKRPLGPESLALVPAELRRGVVEALRSGYADAIAARIEALARVAPAVGSDLRQLAESYEYQALFKLFGIEQAER